MRCFRRRFKRKLSLASGYSMELTSSLGMKQCSNEKDCSAPCSSSLVNEQTLESLTSHLLEDFPMSSLADMNHSGNASDDDDEISSNGCSSSSTCSEDNFTEDDFNKFRTSTHLSDQRPLPSHTTSSVQDFSIDVLQFCCSSRLSKKQRSRLLDLFRRYLPSPNLVPLSADSLGSRSLTFNRRSLLLATKERCDGTDDLAMVGFVQMYFVEQSLVLCPSFEICNNDRIFIVSSIDTIGIGNLHHNERLCGVCQSTTTSGVCSTRHCTHQDSKIPADDVVEIVSFDLVEQIRLLVNHNLNLLRQYQQKSSQSNNRR